jgi:L-2-hydroxyglutarate oxidase LhgO
MSTRDTWDVVVVGGGIVGLATARELLLRHGSLRVLLLEKEAGVGRHQSGHNSGVIHTGIYYKPGSAKARTCVTGRTALLRYCAEKGIEVRTLGKVIVGTDESQAATVRMLLERGTANGVGELRLLDEVELRELEPYVRGVAALHVPTAAIVHFPQVCAALATDIQALGGTVRTGARVDGIWRQSEGLQVRMGRDSVMTRSLVNCGGLQSDRIARQAGVQTDVRIVPFRGEYRRLHPRSRDKVRGLVYPVPLPSTPFLGVHFTPTIEGHVEVGPNAVLAFAREGYRRTDVQWRDAAEMFASVGLWRLLGRMWKVGLGESTRSLVLPVFTREVRKLIPSLRQGDLLPGGAGVRAQAVDGQGRLLDDFHFERGERSLHVLNAPSPAATAALAIATGIVDRAEDWLASAV